MHTIHLIDYGQPLKARADGLIVGRIECSFGGRGYISCRVLTDDTHETEVWAKASAHYYPPNDAHIQYNSLTMPVCKGQRFVVDYEETAKSIVTIFEFVMFPRNWIPFEEKSK